MEGGSQDQVRMNGGILFVSAIISGGIGGFLGNFLTKLFLEKGGTAVSPWPMAIGTLLFAISAAITFHYWQVLGYGAFPKGSQHREHYNRLRTSLRGGGRIGEAYENMLRRTLRAVDGFFCDRDHPVGQRLPRLFGLREIAPLWTTRSYDRCLLIALIYPIAVIWVVWAVSGHVGPAEAALHMPSQATMVQRGLALVAPGLVWLVQTQALNTDRPAGFIGWQLLLVLALYWTMKLAGPAVAAAALVFAYATTRKFAGAAGASSLAIVLLLITVISSLPLMMIVPAFIVILAVATASRFDKFAFSPVYLPTFSLVAFAAALAYPTVMASQPNWQDTGAVLLFVGVLTLVNAPFDWFTLGLTRALLRRGLELGGWWPLAFGALDLVVATAVVVGLAIATLWTVQLFAHVTQMGGGAIILDAETLLAALANPSKRTEPEYWWLYAMLFSTLVPSILNVALGALSLMRGLPGLNPRLAKYMPVGKAVLESERIWIAPLLTLQWILSVLIGLATMLGLLWLILAVALPLLGLNLLPMLRSLAAADLPLLLLRSLGLA